MKNYEYIFISDKNNLYNQALSLRYVTFFEHMNCSKDTLIDNLEKDAIHLICCEDEKKVIGYVRLNIIGNMAQISQLVVDKDYRRIGIASHMMKLIGDEIISRNLKESFLNAKLDAVKFYEGLEYYTVGEVFPSNKTGIPHIKMVKNII